MLGFGATINRLPYHQMSKQGAIAACKIRRIMPFDFNHLAALREIVSAPARLAG